MPTTHHDHIEFAGKIHYAASQKGRASYNRLIGLQN
jgi:hypothetical protein